MAEAAWINADAGAPAYNAQELRRLQAMFLFPGTSDRFGARQGVRPTGQSIVDASGTTWTQRDLTAVIYPGLTSISGPYVGEKAEESGSFDPADGTNDRIDALDLQVRDDDEDASTFRDLRVVYVAGTPAGSPAEPTLTANSLRIGTFDVPASGTPSPSVRSQALWTVATGGTLPVRDDTERPTTGLYDGMKLWRVDIATEEVRHGGAWNAVADINFVPQTDVDNATISGISSTSYTASGGAVVGVAFKAPHNGAVLISFRGVLEDTAGTNNTLLAPEVREGATIGSGTVTLAAADENSVRELTSTRHAYGAHVLVTGLTPGDDYNARLLHRVTAGSTGSVDDRRITVTRA